MPQMDFRLAAALALASHINPSSTTTTRSNSSDSATTKASPSSPIPSLIKTDDIEKQNAQPHVEEPEQQLPASEGDVENLYSDSEDEHKKTSRSKSLQENDAFIFRDAAHRFNLYQKSNKAFCRDPSELLNDPEIRMAMSRACDVMQSPEALEMMRQCASKARRDAAKSQTLCNPLNLKSKKPEKVIHPSQKYVIHDPTLDTPPASWVDDWNQNYSNDTISSTICNKSRRSPCYF
jgi:hypothetical protein